jgi:hypothetical protein
VPLSGDYWAPYPCPALPESPGRYLLTVIDEKLQLLQIAARSPAGQSAQLDTAYAALVDGLNAELADWITTWAPNLTPPQRKCWPHSGSTASSAARFATSVFHQPQNHTPDDQYLNEWTTVLTARIQSHSGSNGT